MASPTVQTTSKHCCGIDPSTTHFWLGIARLAWEWPLSAPGATGIVDLGVLVEDAWQRRGVGTWLVASLLVNARSRGVTTVHADVLGDDLFILEALRRIGPLTVAIEFGTYSIDIDIGRHGGQRSGIGLPVGFEIPKGGDGRLDRARAEELGQPV